MLEEEQATFKPLVFSMTGGMEVKCNQYHSRLDDLVAHGSVSFALLRSALLWLRGSRDSRKVHLELSDIDEDVIKSFLIIISFLLI